MSRALSCSCPMSQYLYLYFVVCLLAGVLGLEEYSHLGSCRDNTVPYKVEVDSHGKPELRCTVPFCFDLVPLKNGDNELKKACDGFTDDGCGRPSEMVGGLMAVGEGDDLRLKTRCCSYSGVEQAKKVRTIALGAGDGFTGGVYVGDNGWEGFDLVKDVRRVVEASLVSYEVVVVRMPCQPKNLDDHRSHSQTQNIFMQPLVQSPRRPLMNSMGFRRSPLNDYYYDYYETEQTGPSASLQQSFDYVLSPAQGPVDFRQQPSSPPVASSTTLQPSPSPPTSQTVHLTEVTTPSTLPTSPTSSPPSSTQKTTTEAPIQPAGAFEKLNPKRIRFNPRWNQKKELESLTEASSSTAETTTAETKTTTVVTTTEGSTTTELPVEHNLSSKEEESLKSSFVQQAE